MTQPTRFVVVLHSDTPLGQSLLDASGQPGGSVREFEAGKSRHPVIFCSSFEASGVPGFVRLVHLKHWPRDDDAQILWVPAGHVVLAVESEGEHLPPGFVRPPQHE
jgi:hypothetical protein